MINAAHATHRPRTVEFTDGMGDSFSPDDPPSTTVRSAVAALPERQRTALFLRYYADLDYDSIGHVLDMRPGTVAATLNKAHAALRRTLEEVRT